MSSNLDPQQYYRFTGPQRLAKALTTLRGLIIGVSVDGRVSGEEMKFLRAWMAEHSEDRDLHPFSEVIPAIESAMADGVFDPEEVQDVLWLCDRLSEEAGYFDYATESIQALEAIVAGIASDGVVTVDEIQTLSDWLDGVEHLQAMWPYDEIQALVTAVLADGKIDSEEQALLLRFFSEFVRREDHRAISPMEFIAGDTAVSLCAVCPDVKFERKTFCFTGASAKAKRKRLAQIVGHFGGNFTNAMSGSVDYLVVGAEGNPCWAFACYGRKVEEAVRLRRNGLPVVIVHESDFWDAVADTGIDLP